MSERFVAVYARVSDADNAAESSIPDQLRDGQAFASQRWPSVTINSFQEVGSAATIAKRPEFCKLLAAVNAGKVAAVVVRDQDRLSRETAEMLQVHALLAKHGCEAWCYRTGQQVQANDPIAKLMLTVMAGVSTFEREITGVRTKARMASIRDDGGFCGGHVPRGYRLEVRDGKKVLVPSGEAPQVRMVFEAAARSRALAYTVRQSRMLGLWPGKSTVQAALRNRVYVGAWKRSDGTWMEGHHEAILSAEAFEAAQQLARLPWNTAKKHQRVNLLQGLVWCTHCGKLLSVTHSQKHLRVNGADAPPMLYYYYHCTAKDRACPLKRVPADAIEAWVWEALGQACQNPRIIEGAIRHFERTAAGVDRAARARVAEIEGRLKELDLQGESLVNWLCSHFRDKAPLPGNDVDKRLTKIDQERQALMEELAREKPKAEPRAKLDAGEFMKRLRDRLAGGHASPKRRAAVVRALIQRVDVEPSGDVHLTIADPSEALPGMLAAGAEGQCEERPLWLPGMDSNHQPCD